MPKYQAYVITVGTEIGVFRKWSDVQHRTSGVPGSAQQGFDDWYEAQEYFEERHRRGETRIVHLAPREDRDRDRDRRRARDGVQPQPAQGQRQMQCPPPPVPGPVVPARGRGRDQHWQEQERVGAHERERERDRGREHEPERARERRQGVEPKPKREKGEGQDGPASGREQRRSGTGRGGATAAGTRSTSSIPASGRAARDAAIAMAVEEARRERLSNGNGVITTSISAGPPPRQHAASASAARVHGRVRGGLSETRPGETVTAPPRLHGASRPSDMRAPTRVVQPGTLSMGQLPQDRPSTRKMSIGSDPSTSSSPLTGVTQTRNIFSSDEQSAGHAHNPAPRYAQSLSYASSPSNASAGLRSPPLSESDQRSHLSSPSSLGTRYYPEDYLARQAHDPAPFRTTSTAARPDMTRAITTRSPRVSDGASSTSGMSEYATAPNTPEMDALEVEELLGVDADVIMAEGGGQASIVEVISPPPPPTNMLSPRAREQEGVAATPGVVSSASVRNGGSGKRRGVVGRSLSEAQVQTEPQDHFGIGRRKQSDAVVQTVSSPRKEYLEQGVQDTRTRNATPLRATASEGTVCAVGEHGRGICACMHPDYVCRHCGGGPAHVHPMASVANHLPSPAKSHASASVSVSSVSSASTRAAAISTPSSTYASAMGSFVTLIPSTRASSRSRGQSMRSPTGSESGAGGGHTPIMGPNETRWDSMERASTFQTAMDAMGFYEPAAGMGEGSEAVVHDVSFDPRSPIHRGTSIPARASRSGARPSPAMRPFNSLGLFGTD